MPSINLSAILVKQWLKGFGFKFLMPLTLTLVYKFCVDLQGFWACCGCLEGTSVLSVLQKLMEVQSSVVAACMGEREMQWCRWLAGPRPQVWVNRMPPQCTAD